MLHRRDLFQAALAAGGASLLGSAVPARADAPPAAAEIIDTNVSLFQWPFRRLPLDETGKLVRKLRSLGVKQAWAGSFEGLLHRDLAGVNDRLARACALYPELVPIGSINPTLPGWEHDLDRCAREHRMPGIRLHPNYHGYTLADPRFLAALQRTLSAGMFVQLAAAMEDPRTQHPLLQVPDVDLAPLPELLGRTKPAPAAPGPDSRHPPFVQILNARSRGDLLTRLAATPGVYFDTARVDGTDGIASLLQAAGRSRVLFGSHAPFLIPEAALIRLAESQLQDDELWLVARDNASAVRKGGN